MCRARASPELRGERLHQPNRWTPTMSTCWCSSLGQSNEVGHLQNGGEQMAGRKMCQPERKLSFERPCWMPIVLFLAVILMWAEAMAAADKLAVFFQPMSPLGDWRRSSCETSMRNPKSGTRRASLWSEPHRQIKHIRPNGCNNYQSLSLRELHQGTSGGT